jgi:hypothetical protein
LAGEPIGPAPQHITLDNVEKYLDFLVKGDNPMLKVLGGEPTLHPQFLEIVHRGRQRGLPTQVFSNALWPRKVQEALSGAPLKEWKLGFVFNVNEPSLQSKAQWEHAKASMKIAGAQGICGFNIYREQFDLQFIPDLMDEAGLERSLRLGLASPIVGTENSFLGIQVGEAQRSWYVRLRFSFVHVRRREPWQPAAQLPRLPVGLQISHRCRSRSDGLAMLPLERLRECAHSGFQQFGGSAEPFQQPAGRYSAHGHDG